MLKKIVFGICLPLAILGAAALSFSGCGKSAPVSDSAGKMKVVATTTMLTDLAQQIGGDKVEVSGLMKAGVDPHLYQAGAGDVDAMNKADIVVYNGVHLEGKMGAIFDNLHAQKKPTIRVSDGIPSETLLDFEEDGEKTKDPHIWFSVKNWKAAAKEVAKGFSEKDPKNKSYYEDHLNAYLAELDNLDKYIRKEVESVPKDSRILVTAHDAFAYFARDYGFEVKGIQGISTASEAGTSDISTLAAFIADHKIKAVFVESSVPHKTIESLQAAVKARGFDVSIGGELYSDSLGGESTKEGTYIGMYEHNIKTITEALR